MIDRRMLLALAAGLATGLAVPAVAEEAEPPRFLLADINGVVVTDETLRGRFAMVFFGYTNCPDICPTSMLTMASVMQALGPDADKLRPLFVTVDPDRDTPELLSQYIAAFDPRIVALRGPKPYLDAMVAAYGARYAFHYPDPADKTQYSVDHTASLIFQGPDGRIITRFAHETPIETITSAVKAAFAATP